MTEFKAFATSGKDPTPKSHNGIRALGRCNEGQSLKATCASGYACAQECGLKSIDWVAGSPSKAQCACWLRPSCVATCDKATTAAIVKGARSEGCGKYEKGTVATKLKLAVSIADVNKDKDKFVENFSKDVAVALKVDQARIGVTGITAGSVVVDYTVAPDASGTPIAPTAVTTAFNAANVAIAGSKTTAPVTAAQVQSPQ